MVIKKDVINWITFFQKLNTAINCYGHSILWEEKINPIIIEIFENITSDILEMKYIINKIKNIFAYDNIINNIYEMILYYNITSICLLSTDIKTLPIKNNNYYLPQKLDVYINEKGEAEFLTNDVFLGINDKEITLYLKDFYFSYEWFLNIKDNLKKTRKIKGN